MRRVVFYLYFDPQGQVDDFVDYKLKALRPHAEHIFVVSNTEFDEANRAKLEALADTVWVRENVGFDVWAYKEAMQVFGFDRLQDFDELILMNYTFFGPIGSFDPLFERVNATSDLDFWGVTEHAEIDPHPYTGEGVMAAHVQSHWIGVRRRMFTSPEWVSYWDDMPMILDYHDSVNRHEARFTEYFLEAGRKHLVAWPASDYPSMHPIMDNAAMMLRDGCPIVKRRMFFHDPLYTEKMAVDGREIARMVEAAGYPIDLLLSNLARTSVPRNLVTNLGMLEVLPEVDTGYDPSRPFRIAAVTHIYYPEMTDEILDRLATIPGGYDLYVTTNGEERRDAIAKVLAARGVEADIRLVGSNNGRDVSAFFVECRDVIDSDDYDLIVKVHSKKSPQDAGNIGNLFKRHCFENLLSSPGYTANVLALFQRYSSLGMVFPPVIHIGYPTLGHAWFHNKGPAEKEAERMGIHVPFDDRTPLAAYGSMYICRPQALRPITAAGYTYDDFPDETGYTDGALSHVLERILGYAALNQGLHLRQVMNADNMATAYSYLEYKHQALIAELPAYPGEQIAYVRSLKRRAARLKAMKKAERMARRKKSQPEPAPQQRRLGQLSRGMVRRMTSTRNPGA